MRHGLLAAGNFIVDHIRVVESWPEQDSLTSIVSETSSNGGGPYNILKDLAAMKAAFPLEAAGLVGDDGDGRWILEDCREAGINTTQLLTTGQGPTSYTEVMSVSDSGRRTFFHRRGANAFFDGSAVDFEKTNAEHFHLAYLMLLDRLDEIIAPETTRATELLQRAKAAGLTTSVDLVSATHANFQAIVAAALPQVDYLFINEIEAGRATGINQRQKEGTDLQAVELAARALLRLGVQRQVIVHFAEGAMVLQADGTLTQLGSLQLPQGYVAGATGAGDAFAAGYLYGLQEKRDTPECLRLAVCAAAACLAHPAPSAGLIPARECLDLAGHYPHRLL